MASTTLLTHLWRRARQRIRSAIAPVPQIDAALWLSTLQRHPFLAVLSLQDKSKLRALSALFLQHKQFTGAHGLVVTDAMALSIAAQACLPLLYWGDAEKALAWYDDFVGIVVHPAEAVARRETVDGAGIVHRTTQVLLGEAMERGPIMLSWPAVDSAGQTDAEGHLGASSVVIHEFVHKLDMHNGAADGYPPLPKGFLNTHSAAQGRQAWHTAWEPVYADFRERVIRHRRFGEPAPWLDAYGATAPAEFFAVACEAYFVQREGFAQEFPSLLPVLDAYFQRPAG